MKPTIVRIEDATLDPTTTYFFDCNIWMFLYCPAGQYSENIIRRYDFFLSKLLNKKSTIVTSSLVLSEFVNRYLRNEFNLYKQIYGSEKDYKKDFRPTPQFQTAYEEAKSITTRYIMKIAKPVDDAFNKIEVGSLFSGTADFNDSYYVKLSSMRDYTLVTHDRDILSILSDITIITALS